MATLAIKTTIRIKIAPIFEIAVAARIMILRSIRDLSIIIQRKRPPTPTGGQVLASEVLGLQPMLHLRRRGGLAANGALGTLSLPLDTQLNPASKKTLLCPEAVRVNHK